jgi:hypothetical protein
MARKKRRLKGVTQDDAIDAAAIVEGHCPKKWKTKQYVPICKKAAMRFLDELGQRGTSPKAIMDAANATDAWCASHYKTGGEKGQYRRVCETVVGGFIRVLSKKRPGLEGRRR